MIKLMFTSKPIMFVSVISYFSIKLSLLWRLVPGWRQKKSLIVVHEVYELRKSFLKLADIEIDSYRHNPKHLPLKARLKFKFRTVASVSVWQTDVR